MHPDIKAEPGERISHDRPSREPRRGSTSRGTSRRVGTLFDRHPILCIALGSGLGLLLHDGLLWLLGGLDISLVTRLFDAG